jgi:hypothetical protein
MAATRRFKEQRCVRDLQQVAALELVHAGVVEGGERGHAELYMHHLSRTVIAGMRADSQPQVPWVRSLRIKEVLLPLMHSRHSTVIPSGTFRYVLR